MGKSKKTEIDRERIESEIRTLTSKLDAPTSDIGDWKIIKIYEARLSGESDPYDYEELKAARQTVRDKINELQAQLKGGGIMQAGLILSQQDIKKIIAEHFKVSEDKVIASKYSFIVVQETDKPYEKKM